MHRVLTEIRELERIRKRDGLSMEKLAAQLGVTYQTVFRWLRRNVRPSPLALMQIRAFTKREGLGPRRVRR